MTRIIIDGLRDRASLLAAISVVLDTMNNDDAYRLDEHVFVLLPAEGATENLTPDPGSVQDPFNPDPGIGLLNTSGVRPYIPCPARTRHLRLTDCWMCWCDVMRGAALEADIIDPGVWERGYVL